MAAAAAGDREARRRLYERFAPVVHGIAVAWVGAQDADDVVQEAFVSILGRLHTLRDGGALPAWICSVARRRALDHLRARRRRPASEPLPDLVDPAGGPDAALSARRILALIRELPPAYREPLVLRLVEGLSGPEIAARTGMTPGSVRVNLCRGMARLRARLEQEGWS